MKMIALLIAGVALLSLTSIEARPSDSKCPPTCSPEFCNDPKTKDEQCSRPPLFSIPPCPDACLTTFCKACYYSDTVLPVPSKCDDVCAFPPSLKCLDEWATCVQDHTPRTSSQIFRCHEYPCPLRG